jgi:hypothetical protein
MCGSTRLNASGFLAITLGLTLALALIASAADPSRATGPHASDAADGVWRRLAPSPLLPRSGHVVVWTGREMIVWGGVEKGGAFADGAAYDPQRDLRSSSRCHSCQASVTGRGHAP